MKNNIVLCGFMGCGKSTVGKLLAEKLGFTFADTDTAIEQCEGMSISDIFARFGEKYFRKTESLIIKELCNKDKLIIATGGGAVLNVQNAETLREAGIVFFLDVTPETVLERLKDDTSRPLLQRSDKESAVRELMEKRRLKYSTSAHNTVDANRDAETVANNIADIYNGIV